MKRAIHGMMLAAMLAGACSGCQSLNQTATVRGQSPNQAQTYGAEVAGPTGHYHTPVRSAASGIQDAYHEHHNTTTYYPGSGGVTGAGGHAACPPQGNCPPQGYNNCPPGGYNSCPPQGQCPPGGCRSGLCRDGFSYGYEVPNDLVYPQENAVGGAVVYPYYTHRGPSDFFRQ
ncbi:hypothetical protein [Planctomicrobium piriforme]|uniref:Lipoprotein n=1 Tax=Planctomicrobium piriforme TaxID=1576369 RepID=A0A1I3BJD3_9PLAN|nr:hypothetical protein [Planctomicrobium piriforme]SFH62434.1 hypothetical protein SAMN05421753_101489 [Planctomicrobium piriforme]